MIFYTRLWTGKIFVKRFVKKLYFSHFPHFSREIDIISRILARNENYEKLTTLFPGSAPHPNLTNEDVGQPLILTPYLEAGQLEKARELSKVNNLSSIETYTGFLTVNKKYDSNLFFWFAPAQVLLSMIKYS